jgi:tetratricopeptide (TPR) repeat protein
VEIWGEMMDKTEEKFFRELDTVMDQDLYASTIALVRPYLSDFPEHYPVRLQYGIALYKLGRYKEAKKEISQVIKIYQLQRPDLPYHCMADLYKQKGDYRRATEWYRKAIDMKSDEVGNFIGLGTVLALDGRLSEAETCHRQGIKCKEGPIDEAYLNLGYVLIAQERYEEALKCFEKALELDPKYKEAKHAIKDVKKVLEIKQRKSWQA